MERPRIGVFICHCGTNIAGVIDIGEVAEYARTLPGVVYVEENIHSCSPEGVKSIQEAVRRHRLDRVVVASCTPRTHESLFMDAVEEAGLNRYLFQMVNIREQCSWVHSDSPKEATEKAKILVRMGVEKARHLEAERGVEVRIEPKALVIGGGVAGMTAASTLANQGFKVILIERERELGGMLRRLHTLTGGGEAEEILKRLLTAIEGGGVEIYTSSTLEGVRGSVGDFDVEFIDGAGERRRIKVGAIIVATGAEAYRPEGLYGYGEDGRVLTQLELEERLRRGAVEGLSRVAMIQCVGAREDGCGYCSNICCRVAMKNAILLKELNPGCDVYIIYRELMAQGVEGEKLYNEALEKGVRFISYLPDKPPSVEFNDHSIEMSAYTPLLNSEIKLDVDLLILSTPLIPPGGLRELAGRLRIPIGPDGFLLEAHPKLRPVETTMDGVFICGAAQSPKDIIESIAQAYAAAGKAASLMHRGLIEAPAITAVVDHDLCIGCGACANICPFNAIRMEPFGTPTVFEAACKGCGLCGVECTVGAMELRYFKDSQLIPAIEGMLTPERWIPLREEWRPVMICFACRWCAYAAADLAGTLRLSYPHNVRIIQVPCSGRVDFRHIFRAFELGADGVMVMGCLKGECHYIDGNLKEERRIELAKRILERIGVGDRLEMFFLSAGMSREFVEYVREFTENIRSVGPLDVERFRALLPMRVRKS
jgi:heterodisulfide reductase subunit A